jgi:antitoxin PrlF
MSDRRKKAAGEGCSGSAGTCCRVEAIIGVDERGQMVLPKELRDRAKIRPGDKLALVSYGDPADICCLTLVKTEELGAKMKEVLGPMLKSLA